jgi:rhamnogalacturonan endolyase
MVVDHDGRGLYSTGLRHGDAMHVSDMVPQRAGLEVFTIHENEGRTVRLQTPGVALRDAGTGAILWQHSPGTDVGRGMAADIDPRTLGYEFWGGPGGLRDTASREIGPAPATTGWAIWWDGDLLRELLSGATIKKWDWERAEERTLFKAQSASRRRHPSFMGDVIGDWREELLLPSAEGGTLCLYTTTVPTEHRLYTLLHDPQYRLSLAWQNVVYNKPPHPGFYLGEGMAAPPRPEIVLIGAGEAIAGVKRP